MGLIEKAKDAAKLVQQIGNLELYKKLVSFQIDALAILDENHKLKDENRTLQDEVKQLKVLQRIDVDMEYSTNGGFYVRKSEAAVGKQIPYCPLCWKHDGKAVPLNPMKGEGYFHCPIHSSGHETEVYRNRGGDRRGFRMLQGPWS